MALLWSPSMDRDYTEKELDRAADLYLAGERSSKRLHDGLKAVEREAVRHHKALIDRQQDQMAAELIREFNMDN